MKTYFLLIVTLGASVFAHSQQSDPALDRKLPDGPLLKRAPEFSRWTTTTETGTDKSVQASFIKTGAIMMEQQSGRQIWHFGDKEATFYPGQVNPIIVSAGGADLTRVNFTKEDFAGLDWVSEESYLGTHSKNGKKTLVFQGKVTNWTQLETSQLRDRAEMAARVAHAQADALAGKTTQFTFKFDDSQLVQPATLYVDFDTRLPLLLIFGANQLKRTYVFQDPPATRLTLPKVLDQIVSQQKARIHDFAKPHVGP